MNDQSTEDRPTKPYGELTHGDVIWHGDAGDWFEVRHVEPINTGARPPRVVVVLAGGRIVTESATGAAQLATEQDKQEARLQSRRRDTVAGLRLLADLIERHSLPVPRHYFNMGASMANEADVRAFAAGMGVDVIGAPDSPRVTAEWASPGALSNGYVLPAVEVRVSAERDKPAPEAVETPEESAAIVDANLPAMGSGGLTEPEVHTDSVSTDSASFRPVETPATTAIPPQRVGE